MHAQPTTGGGITPPTALRPSAHVRSIIDADGAVLLDLKRGAYFALNDIGADIWRHIEAGRGRPEIEEELRLAYDVAPGTLREDVDAFIAQLARDGLLQSER